MALLQKLKSILGLGGSDRDPNQRRDVGVTVEREAGQPNRAESSAGAGAASGSDAAATEATTSPPGTDGQAPEPETPSGDGTDASGAAETDAGDANGAAEAEAETADTTASDAAESAAGAAETADGDDLEDIKGVGPAYAQRLRDAGVDSVAELAAADAEDLAEETDLSATRIGNWIDQAAQR